MFENFLKFVNIVEENKVESIDDFLKIYAGNSFLNGLYRLYEAADILKWNDIIGKSFPKYATRINVFGYDWLGRNFAMDKVNGTVLLFEPGTGETLVIPANFVDFHNIEIAEYHKDSLASTFFAQWYNANNHYVLTNKQCAGYKIPLFLNGSDTIDNLEVSDMEVYWEIMMPLMNI